jgi:hypothetical protein
MVVAFAFVVPSPPDDDDDGPAPRADATSGLAVRRTAGADAVELRRGSRHTNGG